MLYYIYMHMTLAISYKSNLAESDGPLRQTPGICEEDFPTGKSSETI